MAKVGIVPIGDLPIRFRERLLDPSHVDLSLDRTQSSMCRQREFNRLLHTRGG